MDHSMLLQKKILTPISHKLEATCCGYSSPDASLSNYSSNASLKYENLIILVDFNIDNKIKGIDQEILQEFCILFSLTDSIKSETYHKRANKSLINLIFTKKSFSIQTTCITKTDPSNYHKLL